MKGKWILWTVSRKVAKRNFSYVLFTLALILLSTGAALLPPLLLGDIVDKLAKGNGNLWRDAWILIGVIVLSGLLSSLQDRLITGLGEKITHGFRSALSEKLGKLPASYFTAHPAGAVSSLFVNDVDMMDTLFSDGVISMAANFIQIISVIFIVAGKSTGLTALLLLAIPFLFLFTRWTQSQSLAAQIANRAAIARVSAFIPETLANRRMIRTFHVEKHMEDRYDKAVGDSFQAMEKVNLFDSIYSPVVKITSAVIIAILMTGAAAGGMMETFFGVSVGTAVAMIAYVNRIFNPIADIGMEIQTIQSAVAAAHRITGFLGEKEKPAPVDEKPDRSALSVVFDHVSFGYVPERMVIRDFSLSVKEGERITIAGRTGSGKSTLFKLLEGLYEPQEGKITVMGMNPARVPDDIRRKLFGIVSQDFEEIPGTIRDQITMGDPSVTRNQVEKAVTIAGLNDAVSHFEKGLDTPYERATFSAGEKQLLGVARAVAAEPQILLLDEVTAHMDSETEERLLQAIGRAAEGRTVLTISHRMSKALGQTRIVKIGKSEEERGKSL